MTTHPLAQPAPADVAVWSSIDRQQPWLRPYHSVGEPVTRVLAAGDCRGVAEALNRALHQTPHEAPHPQAVQVQSPVLLENGPLRFVPQHHLPSGEGYEAFIGRTASVPTRNNLHDAFNGIVWLTFPRLKRRLNALQVQCLRQAPPDVPGRGAVRDALTLFDENAAWLQAPDAVWNALARRDWHGLFQVHRAAWAEATLVLFGHALLEKLTQPRKAITAHVWRVPVGVEAEGWLVHHLDTPGLAAKPWCPLPVLGVPGWWHENEVDGFYDDASVFRPPPPIHGPSGPRGR